jgi:ribonuclease Z
MKLMVVAFAGALGLFATHDVSAEPIRVTLLGTGSPEASPERSGPSTLVEVGDEKLIFDVGRGATVRLQQAKVPLVNVTVFLTHLHSDHINGLGDLWSSSYMSPTFRDKPLKVFGPTGVAELTNGLRMAFQPDIDIRSAEMATRDLPFHLSGAAFDATVVDREGVVFDKGGVIVTAIRVNHAENRAFGYRVDYDGHSVVISGDTSFSENLMMKAQGADLIIHEVMAVSDELSKDPLMSFIFEAHTSPEQAGSLFASAKPKMAVFTHIILLDVTETQLEMATRKTYLGPLRVGQDLMTFLVDDEVTIMDR